MTTYAIPIQSTTAASGKISINAGASGSGGTSGPIYTTGSTWTNSGGSGKVLIAGDCEFQGNISWHGRDLREWLASIETRLGMLQPNPKLEAEWSELAELRMRYVELEKQLLEKQQVFDILKKPLD